MVMSLSRCCLLCSVEHVCELRPLNESWVWCTGACLYKPQSTSHLCTLDTLDLQQPKAQAMITGARGDVCLQCCASLGHSCASTAAACLPRTNSFKFHQP